jgi:hypothetical protein
MTISVYSTEQHGELRQFDFKKLVYGLCFTAVRSLSGLIEDLTRCKLGTARITKNRGAHSRLRA